MAAQQVVKLVGSSRFRPFRNLWMLEELGIAYEHIPAKPHSAESRANPGFPNKVPSLVVGGEVTLFESAAINTFLADRFRGVAKADLVPVAGSAARGVYDQWVHCGMAELDAQALWIHRKHDALADVLAPKDPVATLTARKHAAAVVKVFAEAIRGDGYLVQDHGFSAADILFVHCCNWAESIGWADDWPDALGSDLHGALGSYLERCRSRAAYARAKALP